MQPIYFEEQTETYGDQQPEYNPLPAHVTESGIVTSCWELNEIELAEVRRTGVIWVSQLTFNQLLQPLLLQVFSPFVKIGPDTQFIGPAE